MNTSASDSDVGSDLPFVTGLGGWEELLACPPDETLGDDSTSPSTLSISPLPFSPPWSPPSCLWSPQSESAVDVTGVDPEPHPHPDPDPDPESDPKSDLRSHPTITTDTASGAPIATVVGLGDMQVDHQRPRVSTPSDVSRPPARTPSAPRKTRSARRRSDTASRRARRCLIFDDAAKRDDSDHASRSSSSPGSDREWRRSPIILRGRYVRRGRLRQVSRPRFRVRQCPCDSVLRYRLRCEAVSVGAFGVARCPLCRDSIVETGVAPRRTASWPIRSEGVVPDSDGGLASVEPPGSRVPLSPGGTTRVIASPWPGLRCLPSVFKGMRLPREVTLSDAVLNEVLPGSERQLRGADMITVYVPRDETFCERRCLAHVEGRLVGRGSFGRVYVLPEEKTALKVGGVSALEETVLTAWISGRVRARAEALGRPGSCGGSVYEQILAATGCCLRHRVAAFGAFDRDLYGFDGWDLSALSSYRRAFAGLADALRFLNLECGVSHFDVTPMNVLVKVNPDQPAVLREAVLCDFSLSQPHLALDGRCALYCQETGDVRLLPATVYMLTDLYHPAFKPFALQKLCILDPTRSYPVSDSVGLCVTDLSALAQVAAFCLVRIVHPGGLETVRRVFETPLFEIARDTCQALVRRDVDQVAVNSSRLLTHQLAYASAVLGIEAMRQPVARLATFFQRHEGTDPAARFRSIYKHVCRQLDIIALARRMRRVVSESVDAAYLVDAVRAASGLVDAADVTELRPRDIFAVGRPGSGRGSFPS